MRILFAPLKEGVRHRGVVLVLERFYKFYNVEDGELYLETDPVEEGGEKMRWSNWISVNFERMRI